MINGVSNIRQNTAYVNGNKDPLLQRRSSAYGSEAVNNFKHYISSFQAPHVELPDVSGIVKTEIDASGKKISYIDEDKFEKSIKQTDNALAEMDKQEMPPMDFELKYSKTKFGRINKMSLLGAAYEELGRKTKVRVDDMSKGLNETFKDLLPKDEKMSAKALDLNDDGYIDVGEYAASILLNDALDSSKAQLSKKDINGKITKKGQNEGLVFFKESEFEKARETFENIYKTFRLDKAQEKFLSGSLLSKVKNFFSSFSDK